MSQEILLLSPLCHVRIQWGDSQEANPHPDTLISDFSASRIPCLSHPIYGNLLQHPRLTKRVKNALEFGTHWRMLQLRGVGSWFQTCRLLWEQWVILAGIRNRGWHSGEMKGRDQTQCYPAGSGGCTMSMRVDVISGDWREQRVVCRWRWKDKRWW